MFRRASAVLSALGITTGMVAAGGVASASAAAPAACSGVIQISRLAFVPPAIAPGQSSTAELTARNCTGQTQRTTVTWLGRFLGPGGGFPAGCPVIDPLAQPATFAPYGTVSGQVGYLVFAGCTATSLQATVRITGAGGAVLAQRTASLVIVQPTAS